MSVDIYYKKLFIKAEDKIVPMILAGSSNCFDASYNRNGNGRRSRDWSNMSYYTGGTILATPEKIQARLAEQLADKVEYNTQREDDKRTEEETKSNWGWETGIYLGSMGKSCTYSAYCSFITNGIKNAVTVEELLENNINVILKVYCWKEEDITSKGKEVRNDVVMTSTQHLIDTVNDWQEYYKGVASIYLRYDYEPNVDRMLKKMHRSKTKNEKKMVMVNDYFVIKLHGYGYFQRKTRKGIEYSHGETYSKKFFTERSATTYMSKLGGGFTKTVEPVHVDCAIKMYK